MRARVDLAKRLKRIESFEAVSEAVSHYTDMLQLCGGDNIGV